MHYVSPNKNGYKWRPEWSSLQDYCRASEKLDVSGNESRFAGKNHIINNVSLNLRKLAKKSTLEVKLNNRASTTYLEGVQRL